MRPKAGGLTQHGDSAWLTGGEWPSRCDFVRGGRAVPPAFSVHWSVALRGAAQLRADWINSCCYIVNVHNHQSWATSRKEDMACYSRKPMSSLWSSLPRSWRNRWECSKTDRHAGSDIWTSGQFFKAQLRLRWGWSSVHDSYCSNIAQVGQTRALLHFMYLVMATEWEIAFFWPTASWHLYCDTHGDGRERANLRSVSGQETSCR